MLNEAIKKIVLREDLSEYEAEAAMNDIMTGQSTPSQIGAFLIALRMKGETIDEITGCASAMKNNATGFQIENPYAIDTCGTGGDGGRTFNISTVVALIAAAAGIQVVKHGNRAVSGLSGSADVLKELGYDIEMETERAKQCLTETGMTFLFAPRYHSAMKYAAPIRKELATRTIFNILGPLTNPAEIKGQVLGVFDKKLTHTLAEVLLRLGRERAMVVHGLDGLDEITTTNYTAISEIKGGRVIDYILDPQEFGIHAARVEEIRGGTARENAEIILKILKGEKGPARDIVVLNAAAALYVGKAAENLREGIQKAEELLDSGAAYSKTMQIINYGRGM